MGDSDSYSILGYHIGLRYPSQTVARAFRHVLGGFLSPSSHRSTSPYEIQESPGKGGYRVTRNGALQGDYPSLSDLVCRVEWAILGRAFETMPYLGLHAGAVMRGARALLLPGDSGAGKTSLVLGLLLQGWVLLSDEAALVHPDTSAVHPFPRTLCVKDGDLDRFRLLDGHAVLDRPGTVLDIGGISCIAPRALNTVPPGRSCVVDTVVFPSFTGGAPASLVEISRSKGLGLLMRHAFNRQAFSERALGILGKLVGGARCFELRSGALNPALDLLRNIH